MKKHLLSLLAGIALSTGNLFAVPACPDPAPVTQPDGSVLTVRLVGDEFLNYVTTLDGYTLIQKGNNGYSYATEVNGEIVASDIMAHDAAQRTPSEKAYLQGVKKHLVPSQSPAKASMRSDRSKMVVRPGEKGLYDYNNFHGLIILVNYNDRQFTFDDPKTLFQDIVAKENFTGFDYPNGSHQTYTGSVRDYFWDNSYHQFSPQFDVIGPVTVPYSQYYVNQTDNIRTVIRAAFDLLDPTTDFSVYDTDNDGTMDMFYVIFAGGGSNFSGNDQRLVWPHAWNMFYDYYDGIMLNRYACSTELYGSPSDGMIDGIGTVCHEFSHVLGLMDEYDTDYQGSGGQSVDPGEWSLMSSGSYHNYARTPTGYSMLERYQSGFAVPEVLDESSTGTFTLTDIDESNHGFRINTTNPKEYFLLENRRLNKWNCYNPGEGMLVFRVDSTSTSPWSSNDINADPYHNYYELVRANPSSSYYGIEDSAGDPFPGTGNVTTLGPETSPALEGWHGINTVDITLEGITETADGEIKFSIGGEDEYEKYEEDFEDMETQSDWSNYGIVGKFCTWNFVNARVTSAGSYGKGSRAAVLQPRGSAETSAIDRPVITISVRATNAAEKNFNFRCEYLDEASHVWVPIKERTSGVSNQSLKGGATRTFRFDVKESARQAERKYRFSAVSGPDGGTLYIDEVKMSLVPGTGVCDPVAETADFTFAMESDGTITVNAIEGTPVYIYDIAGRTVASFTSQGRNNFRLPARGVYIINAGKDAAKVLF